eukprot:4154193-Pleurochrysis_carterae.AAC.1
MGHAFESCSASLSVSGVVLKSSLSACVRQRVCVRGLSAFMLSSTLFKEGRTTHRPGSKKGPHLKATRQIEAARERIQDAGLNVTRGKMHRNLEKAGDRKVLMW